MVLREVGEVLEEHRGLSRKVLEYSVIMKRLVDEAKKPDFGVESWAPLAELVAIDEFERVGPFKEMMNWHDYVDFLTKWASSSDWECSFRRITEVPGLVFLELEERVGAGEYASALNSVSVYEFDAAGRILHLDVYLQMAPAQGGMPKSHGES